MNIPLPGTLLVIAISAFLVVVAANKLLPGVENFYWRLNAFDPDRLSGLFVNWLIERNTPY